MTALPLPPLLPRRDRRGGRGSEIWNIFLKTIAAVARRWQVYKPSRRDSGAVRFF